MSWKVIKLTPEEWANKFSENAHRAVFGEVKPAWRDRISYALLIVKGDDAIGYVTVREYDNETVYWQFGGVLPKYRKSLIAVKCIEAALEWEKAQNKRILTYVQNTNLPMLRFYLAYGFIIIGVRIWKTQTMVDLVKEFDNGNEKPIRLDAKSKKPVQETGDSVEDHSSEGSPGNTGVRLPK